ncbi:MAG: transglycosylase SLT domain-containing protein [Nitrospina sp.]|jgi:soluble lytic murein transglycosylase-like protein|nr:transglycosylase SLT domain-containing protein [Nitrospina sp.]
MLNSINVLQSLERLTSVATHKPENTGNGGYSDPFYSILIKHQLNMIRAWSPTAPNSQSEIDPFSLSKVLLKLKNITNTTESFRPSINSQRATQSYESEQRFNEGSLSKTSLKALTGRIAEKNGIPEAFFKNLIQTESSFDPEALSPKGAMGLGQIMPDTAKELGLDISGDKAPGSVWHPESNLDASARYLKKLYDKYRKEGITDKEAWKFAAGAYNAGMGNISKAINKISYGPVKKWNQVAEVLPQVTGKYSQETIRYVNRLRA